jgi:hypothetical protein
VKEEAQAFHFSKCLEFFYNMIPTIGYHEEKNKNKCTYIGWGLALGSALE